MRALFADLDFVGRASRRRTVEIFRSEDVIAWWPARTRHLRHDRESSTFMDRDSFPDCCRCHYVGATGKLAFCTCKEHENDGKRR
jgi:hypothetical protein